MAFVIVGLGNPGKEYEKTRHNAGRLVVEALRKEFNFPEFTFNKTAQALVSEGKIGKAKTVLLLPETMMNKSGVSVMKYVKSVKAAKQLLVIHDELDIPLPHMKMVFGRNSGGHKGVESIMRSIKTKNFARLRLGISGAAKKNQAKKPQGEEKVVKHVIGKWRPTEEKEVKKMIKKGVKVAELFVEESIEAATQVANTR